MWTCLKRLCVDSGQYGINVPASEYVDDGVRLLRTTDIAEGRRFAELIDSVFISGPVDDCYRLRAGDLLLSRSGTIGRSLTVTSGLEGATFAGYLIRFRPRCTVDSSFLGYAVRSAHFLGQVEADAVVSTIQNFNAERYARTLLWVPRLEEQRRIVEFLNDQVAHIDQAVACRRRQAELVELRGKELARALTTFGDAPDSVIETGIDWMPLMSAEWTLWKIGQVFFTSSGTTPSSDEPAYFEGPYPWIQTGDLRDGAVRKTRSSVTLAALSSYSTLALYDPGALVVAMYGATVGRLGILQTRACVNQACCVLTRPTRISTEYAFYWFLAHRKEILGLASGGGQPNISQEIVRNLRVPAPDIDQQLRLVAILREHENFARALVGQLGESILMLEERKRALITAAVTGEFDVSTASKRAVDVVTGG